MQKKDKIEYLKIIEMVIPDGSILIQLALKEDFLKWMGTGKKKVYVYVTCSPDSDGLHSFYMLDTTNIVILFKQKEAIL